VLPVVSDFLASFPDINVRMVLSDRNVNLVDDHVDLAVRIGAYADESRPVRRQFLGPVVPIDSERRADGAGEQPQRAPSSGVGAGGRCAVRHPARTTDGALKITHHDESTEVPLALGPPR